MAEKKYNSRSEELAEESFGCIHVCENIVCKGCIFSEGDTPFDDTPYKACCTMYPRDRGMTKPNSIYLDGKPCDKRKTLEDAKRRFGSNDKNN